MLETILDYWRGASLFVASCNLICETIVWHVNMHIWKNNYFGCNITRYLLCLSYDCYCQPQRHSCLWYSSLSLPQTNAYYSSQWNHYSLVWVPPPIYIYIYVFVLKVKYADDHGPHVMRTSTTQLKSPMQKSGIPHQSVRRATNQLYMLYSIRFMSPSHQLIPSL